MVNILIRPLEKNLCLIEISWFLVQFYYRVKKKSSHVVFLKVHQIWKWNHTISVFVEQIENKIYVTLNFYHFGQKSSFLSSNLDSPVFRSVQQVMLSKKKQVSSSFNTFVKNIAKPKKTGVKKGSPPTTVCTHQKYYSQLSPF